MCIARTHRNRNPRNGSLQFPQLISAAQQEHRLQSADSRYPRFQLLACFGIAPQLQSLVLLSDDSHEWDIGHARIADRCVVSASLEFNVALHSADNITTHLHSRKGSPVVLPLVKCEAHRNFVLKSPNDLQSHPQALPLDSCAPTTYTRKPALATMRCASIS